MRSGTLAVAVVALLATAALATGANDAVEASLTTTKITGPLPADFVSFSIEVSRVIPTFVYPPGSGSARPSWVTLMKHLADVANDGQPGPGPNIRVGGNSADESAYVPEPLPLPTGDGYRITAADFAAYLAAVPLWNGSLTLGLNFRNSTSNVLAVQHALAAFAYKGPNGEPLEKWIQQVEVGNECDLFGQNGIRSPSYSYSQYDSEFAMYAKDLMAVTGPRRIQGATFCCVNSFVDQIPSYVKQYSPQQVLGTLSYHRYPLSACGGNKVSIGQLLEDSAAEGQAKGIQSIVASTVALGVPFYIGEGNSVVSCGGAYNISNTFAATLWSADILANMAAVGVTRWNFHGTPPPPHTRAPLSPQPSHAHRFCMCVPVCVQASPVVRTPR